MRVKRFKRTKRQPVQYFKRTLYVKGWKNSSTTADVFWDFRATLTDVPSSSEFTALYDQYKINAFKLTIMPRSTEASVGQDSSVIGSVIDYDDNVTPTNVTQLVQYQNLKMTRGSRIHTRYVKPKIATQVFQTGVLPGYGSSKSYIDVASPDVPHYGLKGYIQQTATVQTFDLKVDYYLAMKNVR